MLFTIISYFQRYNWDNYYSILLYGCTTWMLTKRREKKLDSNYTRMLWAIIYWTSPGGNTQQNNSCTATYHPSWKLSKLDEPNMWDTAGEVRTNTEVIYSCGPLHMDKQRQDNQLEPIYNSSVLIQYIAWKTSREWWTIEMGGCERVKEIRVGSTRERFYIIYF